MKGAFWFWRLVRRLDEPHRGALVRPHDRAEPLVDPEVPHEGPQVLHLRHLTLDEDENAAFGPQGEGFQERAGLRRGGDRGHGARGLQMKGVLRGWRLLGVVGGARVSSTVFDHFTEACDAA
ncbi:hypothetical protein HMPREF9440_01596 [Sutterella parvirubra YIT 11816]|uniref:Uncharacterized protein n=1 Tax=Sutterella parvirubra YIT 11816 TaxID=762967 RepID=H3KFS7_9BURK|nr:hypothetical protein HMPREF9440_01596 [Sutterella parvirubra YIT 11816]